MVSFSLMEWNSRTPVEWSWGTLSLNSAKATEISERLKLSGPEIRGEGGVHNNAVNTSGGDVFSGSDLAHFSLSPHSLSASNDLSSREETKTYSTVVLPKDFGEKNQLARASDCGTLGASHGSDESLISLKLGKCTYFEDFCTVSTTDASSLPTIPTSSTNTAKRSRAVYQSTQTLHCQVEGCNVDLKSAKDYYCKHRICVNHSKSPKVIVAGIVRRFCQQCSRFHDLSEFDDKKRSCRRRLSDHNARRRRPRPEAMHFNLSRLPSSLYDFTDGRQRTNIVSNRVPFPVANSTWQSSCSVKVALPQPSLIRPTKAGGIDRHLDTPTEEMSNSISTLHLDASRILPLEGGTPLMLNQGLEASTIVSNLDLSPDLRRALSLLSTNSCGLNESETTTIDHLMHLNQASVIHPVLHAESQNWDPSSEYLRAEQLPSGSMHSLDLHNSSSNPFQECQFLKAPYASGCFYSNQIS